MKLSIHPIIPQNIYAKPRKQTQYHYQTGLKTDISFKSKLGWRTVDVIGVGMMLDSGKAALAEMARVYESAWGMSDLDIKKIAIAGVGMLLGAIISTNALNNFNKSKN